MGCVGGEGKPLVPLRRPAEPLRPDYPSLHGRGQRATPPEPVYNSTSCLATRVASILRRFPADVSLPDLV